MSIEVSTGERCLSGGDTDPSRVQSRALKRSYRTNPPRIASRMGRIRVAARRCFIVSQGAPILARDVLERAYPRLRQFKHWHRWSARRALLQVAVVVARCRGRPNLWVLK